MKKLLVLSLSIVVIIGLILVPGYQPAFAKGFSSAQWYKDQRIISHQETPPQTTTTTTTTTTTSSSSSGGCTLGKYDKSCFDPVTNCTFTKYDKSCDTVYSSIQPSSGKGYGAQLRHSSFHYTVARDDTTPVKDLIVQQFAYNYKSLCFDSSAQGLVCVFTLR